MENIEKDMNRESAKETGAAAKLETGGAASAVQKPVQEIVQRIAPVEAALPADIQTAGKDEAEALRRELESARERVTQLERERWLTARGVPEEDLDYCVYKIGKMTGEGKDFAAAAEEFLQARRARARAAVNTGASLADRAQHTPGPNETMNRIIRGGQDRALPRG